MNYEDKILKLMNNGYTTTKEVSEYNIPRIYLTKLIRKNKIERASRGIYVKKNNL